MQASLYVDGTPKPPSRRSRAACSGSVARQLRRLPRRAASLRLVSGSSRGQSHASEHRTRLAHGGAHSATAAINLACRKHSSASGSARRRASRTRETEPGAGSTHVKRSRRNCEARAQPERCVDGRARAASPKRRLVIRRVHARGGCAISARSRRQCARSGPARRPIGGARMQLDSGGIRDGDDQRAERAIHGLTRGGQHMTSAKSQLRTKNV